MRQAVLRRALCFSFVLLAAASATAQRAELIDINRAGTASGHRPTNVIGHASPGISHNARFVPFGSGANDLVANDTNGHTGDAFLRDRQTNTTTLVSVNRFGTGTGNDSSGAAAVTPDGRFVLVSSRASDLVANDTNGNLNDVFVRDMQTNSTTLVSVRAAGTGSANAHSNPVAISADGAVVLFTSAASDLVALPKTRPERNRLGGFAFNTDVYARDLRTGVTTLVTINRDGTRFADEGSDQASMSEDGRLVVFVSSGTDYVANDVNDNSDVFVRDLQTGQTSLVSVNRSGTSGGTQYQYSSGTSISADGRFVAFSSLVSDLVTNDVNDAPDVFVRDLQTNTTRLVSVNRAGTSSTTTTYSAGGAQVTPDGRYVAFLSYATDLTEQNTTNTSGSNLFVRDLATNTTQLASADDGGNAIGVSHNSSTSISGDGRFAAFVTSADQQFGGIQVRVRDLQQRMTILASRSFDGVNAGDGPSVNPRVSRDGRAVIFSSLATDLVRNDTNRNSDIFVYPLDAPPTEPVTNLPPSIALTAPADFTWIEPTPSAAYEVTLTADAGDADGSVARVDFYANAVLVGSAAASPYSFRWTNIPEGDYRITAVARDDQGEFTTSNGARLKVGRLPTYTVAGRATDRSGNPVAGVRVVLEDVGLTIAGETTTDANGNYRLENIVGKNNGITTGDPISYAGFAFGSYFLRATKPDYYFSPKSFNLNSDRIIDVTGQQGFTPPPFGDAPTPPTVALTSPATGATFAANTPVTLTAAASDDKRVAKVEFYRGLTKIGEDISAPYSVTWQNPAAGNYVLRAKAIDDDNAATSSSASNVTVTGSGSNAPAGLRFYPLVRPVRLLDTRAGAPAYSTPGAPLAADGVHTQAARGVTYAGVTIPAEAVALVGSATAVNTTANKGGGYMTLYPSGAAAPTASNLNYAPDQIVANAFTVRLGDDGAFQIYTNSETHMIADITGYYAPPAAGGLYYHALPKPVRLLDTRAGAPACNAPEARTPLDAGSSRVLAVAGTTCGGVALPSGALAAVGTATIVNTTADSRSGYLTLYPEGEMPVASNVNYAPGQIVANAFTIRLGADGAFRIYTSGEAHFITDVTGYYSAEADDENGAGLLYHPLARPVRLLDTRPGEPAHSSTGAPLAAGSSHDQVARGITYAGTTIPAEALAVVGNATAINTTANNRGGYITLYPGGQAVPTASNLNYASGQIVAGAFIVRLGGNGAFGIHTSGETHFVADAAGYFAAP